MTFLCDELPDPPAPTEFATRVAATINNSLPIAASLDRPVIVRGPGWIELSSPDCYAEHLVTISHPSWRTPRSAVSIRTGWRTVDGLHVPAGCIAKVVRRVVSAARLNATTVDDRGVPDSDVAADPYTVVRWFPGLLDGRSLYSETRAVWWNVTPSVADGWFYDNAVANTFMPIYPTGYERWLIVDSSVDVVQCQIKTAVAAAAFAAGTASGAQYRAIYVPGDGYAELKTTNGSTPYRLSAMWSTRPIGGSALA